MSRRVLLPMPLVPLTFTACGLGACRGGEIRSATRWMPSSTETSTSETRYAPPPGTRRYASSMCERTL